MDREQVSLVGSDNFCTISLFFISRSYTYQAYVLAPQGDIGAPLFTAIKPCWMGDCTALQFLTSSKVISSQRGNVFHRDKLLHFFQNNANYSPDKRNIKKGNENEHWPFPQLWMMTALTKRNKENNLKKGKQFSITLLKKHLNFVCQSDENNEIGQLKFINSESLTKFELWKE